jgi:arylsulfatase A-like enzyme
MGPELGAYGQEHVRTPHLDSLAARGMLFTHAFTTSPVCSPSRSALNTGMYQFTIGAHNHRSHRPDDPSPYPHPLPEGVETVSDWLRHAGNTLLDNAGEYLTEEQRSLPTAAEVERFISGVDRLRADADRLQARVRRLRQQRDGEG